MYTQLLPRIALAIEDLDQICRRYHTQGRKKLRVDVVTPLIGGRAQDM